MSPRALLVAFVFSIPSIVVAQTGTLKSAADLTVPSLLSNAGKVLPLPAKVAVEIDYDIEIGKLAVSDWQGEEFCTSYGPSPNGEPELAECLEYSTKWSPKVTLEARTTSSWSVADMQGEVREVDSVDLSKCVRDFDSLSIVQDTKPTASLPTLIIEKNCSAYTYAGQQSRQTSPKLANADVFVEVKFGTFLNFDLPSEIVVENGDVKPADQSLLASTETLDPSYTQVIFDPTVKRGGQTIRLFNYPAVVYFR